MAKQKQGQAQIVKIQLGNLKIENRELESDLSKAQKAAEKLRKDLDAAREKAARDRAAAASAKASKTGLQGQVTQLRTDYQTKITDAQTLSNQLGAKTAEATLKDGLYSQAKTDLTAAQGQVSGLQVTVAQKEGEKNAAVAQKEGEKNVLAAQKTAADADVTRLNGEVNDLEKIVDGDPANADPEKKDGLRKIAGTRAVEVANEKGNVRAKDVEISYLKKIYNRVLAAIVATAIVAGGAVYLLKGSGYAKPEQKPAVEQKVEDKKADKPADGSKTDKPADGTKTDVKPEAPKPENPFRYHGIEARLGDSWYTIEPSEVASEYRVIVKNKVDGKEVILASKIISQDAIHGEEGYLSLVKKLLEQDKRADYDPPEYEKLVSKLPGLDVSGDGNTITKTDVAKAHSRVNGGLKAILGD